MNRNIGLSIVLSIITCGIYGIYWLVVLTNEINQEKAEYVNQPSGIVCFLLGLITCGIYMIYWAYKLGEKLNTVKAERGMVTDNNTKILYLILEIFGLGIIVLALAQNEMNTLHPLQPQQS